MLVQLTGLKAIKAPLASGLIAGLEEITLEAGKDLAQQIDDHIRQELTELTYDSKSISAGEVFSPLLSSQLVLFSDPSGNAWRWRPEDQPSQSVAADPTEVQLFQQLLSERYQPWNTEAGKNWPFHSDSVLTIFYQENYFTPILELYFKPILHPETGIITGIVGGKLDRFALKERIVVPFLEKALSPDLPKRPDGIDPEFVFMSLREPDGDAFYSTSFLPGGNTEVSIPLDRFTRYLAPMELRAGFLWKNSEAIAHSIYRRNFWMIVGVFCCLLILMVAMYLINRKADQLDRLKSAFLINVGHELKTPLSAIRLAGDSLRLGRAIGVDQQQRAYAIIHQESIRLQAKINTLLEAGKMQTGRRAYRLSQHHVAQYWPEWSARFIRYATLHEMDLDVDRAAPDCSICMDPQAVEEGIMILLDNAIQHANSRGAIQISHQISDDMWIIDVRDQGIGIPAADQSVIFDPFVRLGDDDIQNGSGHGLGLYIARSIVETHKGKIAVESTTGHGATFRIKLPIT